jgi:hypothetical protein
MMMVSVTTEWAIPASNANGFQTLKGEHQVRYDDGMTPNQTITDGAEPNSKLTAKMSVPGSKSATAVKGRRGSYTPKTRHEGGRSGRRFGATNCRATLPKARQLYP